MRQRGEKTERPEQHRIFGVTAGRQLTKTALTNAEGRIAKYTEGLAAFDELEGSDIKTKDLPKAIRICGQLALFRQDPQAWRSHFEEQRENDREQVKKDMKVLEDTEFMVYAIYNQVSRRVREWTENDGKWRKSQGECADGVLNDIGQDPSVQEAICEGRQDNGQTLGQPRHVRAEAHARRENGTGVWTIQTGDPHVSQQASPSAR